MFQTEIQDLVSADVSQASSNLSHLHVELEDHKLFYAVKHLSFRDCFYIVTVRMHCDILGLSADMGNFF